MACRQQVRARPDKANRACTKNRTNPKPAELLAYSAQVGAGEAHLRLVEALAVRFAGKGGRSLWSRAGFDA